MLKVAENGTVELTIDGKRLQAREGEKILWAALDAGIEIPHLCAIREANPPLGSCRLCFVDVEGLGVVASCVEPVAEGMVVHTDGERAVALRKRAMELLLADHPMECKTCVKKGKCDLLQVARSLKVKKPKNYRPFPWEELPVDDTHPVIVFDPNRCIRCGRCVWVCKEKVGHTPFEFAHRGYNMRLMTFLGRPLGETGCTGCGECVEVCPVGALYFKEEARQG